MSKNIFSLPKIMFTTRDLGDDDGGDLPGEGSGEGTPHVPMLSYSDWLNSDYADGSLYGAGGDPDFDDYRQWWQNNGFAYFAWVDINGNVSWTPGDPYP